MKNKTLILIIFILVSNFIFSQTNVQFEKHNDCLVTPSKISLKNQKSFKDVTPEWQVTFDEAIPSWTIGHSNTTSKDWTIGEESTRPCYWGPIDEDSTQWYVYSMDYLYELLEISTTPNKYAYIDIVGDRTGLYYADDELPAECEMSGTGQTPFDTWILFDKIDMSDIDIPYFVYYNSYRESNAIFFDCLFEYSIDDGNSWSSIDVNKDSDGEDGWHYGEYAIGLPECANNSNVDIRFRHTSDTLFTTDIFELYPSSWAWLIDDIRLYDYTDFGIDYDLIIKDTRINFFDYIDYTNPDWAEYNVFHYSSYYGQAPQEQYADDIGGFLWFNATVENNGAETVIPKVNVKVTKPWGGVVFNEVVEGILTPFTKIDTLDMIEVDCILPPFEPWASSVPTGRYEVTFNAFVEGHENDDFDNTNNIDTAYFYVTDNTFSREADDINGSMTASKWFDGGGDGDGIGTVFSLFYEDDIKSVDVFIDEETTVGAMINAEICEYSTSDNNWIPVLTSDPFIIDASHLGQWVHITFNDTYYVDFDEEGQNKELLVGIICYYIGGDVIIGESTVNNHSSYSTRWKFANGDGKWREIFNYYGGPAIRLNYGNINDISDNLYTYNPNEFSLYPNPTTGVLYLNGVEGADVQISNMMGQVVESIENANEFNQVDMSSYANGTYFVKVVVDNKVTTRKINLMK